MNRKIILRIKGGLGNQLFAYCAAKRFALVNNSELVIDSITGFIDDLQYSRRYSLDHFNITARLAIPRERLEPFSRYKRKAIKLISRGQKFEDKIFLEEQNLCFDERFLNYRLKRRKIYLEGYFQSEKYFKDIESNLRNDLKIIPPVDETNQKIARSILNTQSVALHVRWFSKNGSSDPFKVEKEYYKKAINIIESKVSNPHYFIFSDDPISAKDIILLPNERSTFISNNNENESAYADLWLMTLCKNFIIANSTFSWWGAWLSESSEKIVICPDPQSYEGKREWSNLFFEEHPEGWIKI